MSLVQSVRSRWRRYNDREGAGGTPPNAAVAGVGSGTSKFIVEIIGQPKKIFTNVKFILWNYRSLFLSQIII